MSKKRFGDRRLEQMSREDLLVYARNITREHGRAQAAINRLIAKLRMWEGGRPPAPFTHRQSVRVGYRRLVHREGSRDAQ